MVYSLLPLVCPPVVSIFSVDLLNQPICLLILLLLKIITHFDQISQTLNILVKLFGGVHKELLVVVYNSIIEDNGGNCDPLNNDLIF